MDYKVIFTRQAEKDLDEIIGYMRDFLYSPQAAEHFLSGVEKTLKELASMPEMYSLSTDPVLQTKKLRKALVGRYLLLFRIDSEKRAVYIMHIAHGSQDYSKLF